LIFPFYLDSLIILIFLYSLYAPLFYLYLRKYKRVYSIYKYNLLKLN